MTNKILVPIDYSEVSKHVLQFADQWAHTLGAELFILHVTHSINQLYYPISAKDSFPITDLDEHDNTSCAAEEFIAQAKQHLFHYVDALHLQSEARLLVRSGIPYMEIIGVEHEFQMNLIVMAAHAHKFIGRLFLGSNTDYVLHHSRCPVYVFREHATNFEKKIIVPLEYDHINEIVVRKADTFAQTNGASLYFIHSIPDEYELMENPVDAETNTRIETELGKQLSQFIHKLDVKSLHYECLTFGKPYLKILDLQRQQNAGLIMIASHRHTSLERMLMGSNTDYLVHHAACPMYVYKESLRLT